MLRGSSWSLIRRFDSSCGKYHLRHFRVIWAKMLQDHHGLELAAVRNSDAGLGGVLAHEELVAARLTEPQNNGCLSVIFAEFPVPLEENAPIGGAVPAYDGLAWRDRKFLGSDIIIPINDPF